jgi:hypothetical protein
MIINGLTVIVKAAHVGLCHSRCCLCDATGRDAGDRVYPRPGVRFVQGHLRARIYANMKTAVETIFVGKDRLYNRRFLQTCSHYLIDRVACTPGSGWEKGQVDNQVGSLCSTGSTTHAHQTPDRAASMRLIYCR